MIQPPYDTTVTVYNVRTVGNQQALVYAELDTIECKTEPIGKLGFIKVQTPIVLPQPDHVLGNFRDLQGNHLFPGETQYTGATVSQFGRTTYYSQFDVKPMRTYNGLVFAYEYVYKNVE